MSNKNYNNFYNQKPAETPNTPAEEIKELEQELTEGEENLNSEEPIVEQEGTELPEVEETDESDVEVDSEEETETETEETETETEEESEEESEEETETEDEESETEKPVTKNVQMVRVAVGSLNVRNAADKDSKIITVVKKGDELELRESTEVDGFYAVKTKNGTFGYCMVDFVELV